LPFYSNFMKNFDFYFRKLNKLKTKTAISTCYDGF